MKSTTKENLVALIDRHIYDHCVEINDGGAFSRYHDTADLRVEGLPKLSIKELRQLKFLLEMNRN